MRFTTAAQLQEHCRAGNISISLSENTGVFGQNRRHKGVTFANALAILPMEGCDADETGAPSELTNARYLRFAQSGAALIWMEAAAVAQEGRNSPHQLLINDHTAGAYEKLVRDAKRQGKEKNGFEPVIILQLTHSGRYSKPGGTSEPVLASHNIYLDERFGIAKDKPVIADEALQALEETYLHAAGLAKEAGFDGVDIKACHGYLVSELLGAFARDGLYGGDYQGRTRFLRNVIGAIHNKLGSGAFLVATRINVFDAIPYGWGMERDGSLSGDMSEPVTLLGELQAAGLDIAGITAGNPYYAPQYNRPSDAPGQAEEPLKSVERHLSLTARVKRSVPSLLVAGAGYTYLGAAAAQAGAFTLEHGRADFIGFGRQAFAYPGFAGELLANGEMDASRMCVCCGKCSMLMRAQAPAGCAVRDKAYGRIFRQYCK